MDVNTVTNQHTQKHVHEIMHMRIQITYSLIDFFVVSGKYEVIRYHQELHIE